MTAARKPRRKTLCLWLEAGEYKALSGEATRIGAADVHSLLVDYALAHLEKLEARRNAVPPAAAQKRLRPESYCDDYEDMCAGERIAKGGR